ncbi:RnfH family protein [Pseudoxanthomonas kaohsiungensis]|uniref:UPF0125 protein ACFQ2N_11340 n=1 Tax=Pseudoxanthomonas kaohsiungensis TaxID=283923 RepID=A0ABW3LX48_9GAMM|nr:RnfH family protein [Pseudoxanthomonas kaohsiungensis]
MPRVQVVIAWPHRHEQRDLRLADGATVGDALRAAALADEADLAGVAVFGVLADRSTVLREGDRVELLRPLLVDPKEARRRRALRQREG